MWLVTDAELQKLVDAIEEDTGNRVTKDEAREIARRCDQFYWLLHQPLPKKQPTPPEPLRRKWVRKTP